MKILYVTGCLGFIGSYVTRECLEKGWYVRGIDIMTYASNPELLDEFEQYPNFIFEHIEYVSDHLYLLFLDSVDFIISESLSMSNFEHLKHTHFRIFSTCFMK